MRFSWFDLIAPWGTGLVAVALCVWGAVVAGGAGRIVCVVTGLAFAASIPLLYAIRAALTKPTYTARGMAVVIDKDHPAPIALSEMEDILEELSRIWVAFGFFDDMFGQLSLPGTVLYLVSDKEISFAGRRMRGCAFGHTAIVCWAREQTEMLVRHEVSHLMLSRSKKAPKGERAHHELFKGFGF